MSERHIGKHRKPRRRWYGRGIAALMAASFLFTTQAPVETEAPAQASSVQQFAVDWQGEEREIRELAAQKDAKRKALAEAKRKAAAAAKRKAVAKARAEAKKKALAAKRRWVRPISYYVLTSGYGWRWGKLHPAQDLAVPTGTVVRAMSSGTVIYAGWSTEGYGHLVKIRYWDGTVSWYAHNSKLTVRRGQKVNVGQTVAHSGNTGYSTGPHLHLEIHPKGKGSVPPAPWLKAKGIPL